MVPITLHVNGTHYIRGGDHAILLADDAPPLSLRPALVARGAENHIFAALVVDDWGRERKGPGLYRWLYEQGDRYPRSEIFGFDAQGDELQIFLRDLELSYRLPCYLFEHDNAPIAAGQRLQYAIIAGAAGLSEPQKIAAPEDAPFPLRHGALGWRQIDPVALAAHGWQQAPAA